MGRRTAVGNRGQDQSKACHLASSRGNAEAWINDHPDMRPDEYWFAAWEQPIDGQDYHVKPDVFYASSGEALDAQPIDHDAENRRAEQGGLSPNIPGEEGYTPHAGS